MAQSEPMYTVEMTNCLKGGRHSEQTHTLPTLRRGEVIWTDFTFKAGERKKFPKSIALRILMLDPAWRVRNTKDQIVVPRKPKGSNSDDRTVVLGPDEFVCKVDHILKNRLEEMAEEIPGWQEHLGADLNKVKREDLEEFVVAGGYDTDADLYETIEVNDD